MPETTQRDRQYEAARNIAILCESDLNHLAFIIESATDDSPSNDGPYFESMAMMDCPIDDVWRERFRPENAHKASVFSTASFTFGLTKPCKPQAIAQIGRMIEVLNQTRQDIEEYFSDERDLKAVSRAVKKVMSIG